MRKTLWAAFFALLLLLNIPLNSLASPWGASYFPNVPLTDQDGNTAYFFEDLIKDKVVVINFIYTSCPDTCPLETAKLVRVQNLLGDRLGKDVFIYSISIDPKTDTPEVLKEYKEGFRANWRFFTGKESDIIQLRKKLGLYIEEIQDGSNNHNVNLIIGNQKTGRWMKRSPFENAHVLADQIGNWLTGWKKAPIQKNNYASAPELRSIGRGEQIYRTRCASCHSLKGKDPIDALGPDLLGVNQRREQRWLYDWLRAPDQMLAKKDPIALAMYKQYKNLAMPNFRLNKGEADVLLEYIAEETRRVLKSDATLRPVDSEPVVYEQQGDVVAIMNSWVREAPHAAAKVNAGYMTLVNVGTEAVTLVRVESDAFNNVEVHEMAPVDGFMKMREVIDMEIPVNGKIQLAPGGKHLMMMGPKKYLKTGQEVEMTLFFKSGKQQTLSVNVAAR